MVQRLECVNPLSPLWFLVSALPRGWKLFSHAGKDDRNRRAVFAVAATNAPRFGDGINEYLVPTTGWFSHCRRLELVAFSFSLPEKQRGLVQALHKMLG
jgi:hypothetical protein